MYLKSEARGKIRVWKKLTAGWFRRAAQIAGEKSEGIARKKLNYNHTTPETSEKLAIKDYLKRIGAFYYHNLAGFGTYIGVPDITAIHNGRVYQIEVKVGKNKQSAGQVAFQKDWVSRGGYYICGGLTEVMIKIKARG